MCVENIKDTDNLRGKFSNITVNVEIFNSYKSVQTILELLDTYFFGCTLKVCVVNYNFYGCYDWTEEWVHKVRKVAIQITHSLENDLIKHIAHVPALFLHCSFLSGTLDLSPINADTNEELVIVLSSNNVQYIDISKVTYLHIARDSKVYPSFMRCMKESIQNTGVCRIKVVHINNFDNVDAETWREIVELLPLNTLWKIEVESPICMWYIDVLLKHGVSINHIKFNCNSRETWLAALLITQVYDDIKKCEIVLAESFKEEYLIPDLHTATDYYNAMEPKQQIEWSCVMLAFSKSSHRYKLRYVIC
jgi:hypothetical protein